MGVVGRMVEAPSYTPHVVKGEGLKGEEGSIAGYPTQTEPNPLEVRFRYEEPALWPWSGPLYISIAAHADSRAGEVAGGVITFTVESDPPLGEGEGEGEGE